jgi:hypothetical protein
MYKNLLKTSMLSLFLINSVHLNTYSENSEQNVHIITEKDQGKSEGYKDLVHSSFVQPMVQFKNGKPIVNSKIDFKEIISQVDMTYAKSKFQDIMEEFEIESEKFNKSNNSDEKKGLRAVLNSNEYRAQYHIRKLNNYQKQLTDKGWEFKPFEGLTGYIHGGHAKEDEAGFIGFNKDKSILTINWHGSRNGEDWKANLDGVKTPVEELGGMEVHRGFWNRVKASLQQIDIILDEYMKTLTEEQRKNVIVVNTGHSQGAALSTLTQLYLITKWAPKYFGENYKNDEANHIQGLHLSCPRSVAEEFIEKANKIIGAQNFIRYNVHGDIVPLVAMRATATETLKGILKTALMLKDNKEKRQEYIESAKKLPVIGKYVDEYVSKAEHYINENKTDLETYLELPQIKDTIKEYEGKPEKFVEHMTGYGDLGTLALIYFPEALNTSLEQSAGHFWTRLKNNYKLYKEGKEEFYNIRMKMIGDIIFSNLAPFHGGSTVEGTDNDSAGGAFEPNIFSADLAKHIQQGSEHEKNKENSGTKNEDSIANLLKKAEHLPKLAEQLPDLVKNIGEAKDAFKISTSDKLLIGLKQGFWGIGNFATKFCTFGYVNLNKQWAHDLASDIQNVVFKIVGQLIKNNNISLDSEIVKGLETVVRISLSHMVEKSSFADLQLMLEVLMKSQEMDKKGIEISKEIVKQETDKKSEEELF